MQFSPLACLAFCICGQAHPQTLSFTYVNSSSPLAAERGFDSAAGEPATLQSSSTGMPFIRVKDGFFQMGVSARADWLQPALPLKSETEHLVHISRSFYLGQFEVTQKEYESVMGHNPSWFSAMGKGKSRLAGKETESFPVESVTWFEAVEFCNRLSVKDGLPPYYLIAPSPHEVPLFRLKGVSIAGGKGYRLPTEAEWEMAGKAGGSSKFPFGNDFDGTQANCQPMRVAPGFAPQPNWTALGRTEKVGAFPVNKWGFADMSGNVAEWCWDWFDDSYYGKSRLSDPSGPEFGRLRIVRGGSWVQTSELARTTYRHGYPPAQAGYSIGFRVARNP